MAFDINPPPNVSRTCPGRTQSSRINKVSGLSSSRVSSICFFILSDEFGDEGGEEVRGGGAGGGELRFQRVHQGHQLLHFGHDPALFGEGWEQK